MKTKFNVFLEVDWDGDTYAEPRLLDQEGRDVSTASMKFSPTEGGEMEEFLCNVANDLAGHRVADALETAALEMTGEFRAETCRIFTDDMLFALSDAINTEVGRRKEAKD